MSELESFERDFDVHRYSFRRNRVMKVVYLIESDVLLSCLAEISSSDLSRLSAKYLMYQALHSEQIALIHYLPHGR